MAWASAPPPDGPGSPGAPGHDIDERVLPVSDIDERVRPVTDIDERVGPVTDADERVGPVTAAAVLSGCSQTTLRSGAYPNCQRAQGQFA